MKRSRKRKCEIHRGFNLTRLALYDATITKMPITNITCTRGTHYLFRCKELYKKIFYIAPDINKKDFPLMNVFLTFDSVTMRRLNLSKMQREARFQNSEYAFHRPPPPPPPPLFPLRHREQFPKFLTCSGYSLVLKSKMATMKTDKNFLGKSGSFYYKLRC